ncbi:MAG: SCP2 sterol-binding domain-containing protein [Pseudomonadota bacterium]
MSKTIVIQDPPTMNLLGLIVGNILERNIADPKARAYFAKLGGDVVVQAGEMFVTLEFKKGELVITRTLSSNPRAKIKGALRAFVDLALGKSVFGLFLSGRLKIQGNPFFLLKMKPLLLVKSS